MRFKEYSCEGKPVAIFLHGGGLNWWSWDGVFQHLKDDFSIVLGIIDGHGEAGGETFFSIQNSAEKLTDYILKNHQGKVHVIAGLSIGTQIAAAALAESPQLAEYAIMESGLFIPSKSMASSARWMAKMSYPLIKKRWFSRLQAKTLFVSPERLEDYYQDSQKMTKDSLVNMLVSNSTYKLPKEKLPWKAKTIILVGGKEISVMKRSAKYLQSLIPDSEIMVIPKAGHGEFSLTRSSEYAQLLLMFCQGDSSVIR